MCGSRETRVGLIELAKANGYQVSATQLSAWHRYGLIPKPEQVHLGRGRGTTSVYPAGTGEQLLSLCELHLDQGEKRLDYVAWRLWWEEYDVSLKPVRSFLGRVAGVLDRTVRELVDPNTGELSELAWEQIEQSPTARLGKPLGGVRRRVGRDLFPTVLRAMYGVTTGTFDGLYSEDPDEAAIDRRALEKGFGLERARTDRIGGNDPWLPGAWVEEALGEGAKWLGEVVWTDELAASSDEQLLQARDETRFVLALFGGFSLAFDELIGRGAFGLSVLGEAIRVMGPPEQGSWLLMWAAARFRGPAELRAGLEENFAIEPEMLEGVQSSMLLRQLKVEFPGMAEALPPHELAASLRDPDRMDELQARLDRFRAEHTDELEAFFDVNPGHHYDGVQRGASARALVQNHEERR